MSLLVRTLTGLAAVAAAAIGWGIHIFLGAIAAFLVIIIGAGVIRNRRRDDAPESVPPLTGMPPVVRETRPGAGLFCLWCHPSPAGRAGRCGCTAKCKDVDWCIGDYTTLSGPEFTARLEEMLNEGGQP